MRAGARSFPAATDLVTSRVEWKWPTRKQKSVMLSQKMTFVVPIDMRLDALCLHATTNIIPFSPNYTRQPIIQKSLPLAQ